MYLATQSQKIYRLATQPKSKKYNCIAWDIFFEATQL